MEQITLFGTENEEITVYVLEETTINQQKYLLVTEEETGDSEAFILKEIAQDEQDCMYAPVEDDTEFEAIVKVFAELVEDADFQI